MIYGVQHRDCICIGHFNYPLLNPLPPSLEDLKYKKYKTIIDEITRPKVEPVLDLDQGSEPSLGSELSPGSDPDLQSYFQTMYDFNSIMDFNQ